MNKKVLRAGLTVLVLAVAGWLMGDAASKGNAVLFTAEAIIATVLMAAIAALGPVQKADERAVKRSEQAALIAVRLGGMLGLVGGAYAQILGVGETASAFLAGMIVPALLWVIIYWILNWRDVQ